MLGFCYESNDAMRVTMRFGMPKTPLFDRTDSANAGTKSAGVNKGSIGQFLISFVNCE